MPNRDFDSATWNDSWFEALTPEQKLLFVYTWTNNHCTPCGMYNITFNRMAYETGLDESEVRRMLPSLEPKIMYDPDKQILWVRNFVRKQKRGDAFLVGVGKSLLRIGEHFFVGLFLDEYRDVIRASQSLSEVLLEPLRGTRAGAVSFNKNKRSGKRTRIPATEVASLLEESLGKFSSSRQAVDLFLRVAASKNKTERVSDTKKLSYLAELAVVMDEVGDEDLFRAAILEMTGKGIANINYLKKIITSKRQAGVVAIPAEERQHGLDAAGRRLKVLD